MPLSVSSSPAPDTAASPDETDRAPVPVSSASPDRPQLVAAVLEEMGAWGARSRLGAMRRWHRGALSLLHLNVLNVLEVDGPISMTAVADALDVSIASATGIVDRMEKRGLVERRHGTQDRRVVEVHAAEQGLAVIREMESQMREHFARVLEELTDDELSGFLVGIRAMRSARRRIVEAAGDGANRDGAETATR